MNVSFQPHFCSNTRYYKSKDGNPVGTYTRLFRADLDWERFSDFLVKHFNDKDHVQFVQFASSDGSEAYTQIISLLKKHKNVGKFFPIQAYDIDKEIYEASKSGLINLNINDIYKLDNFKKYFKKTSDRLVIEGDTLTDSSLQDNPSITYKVSKVLTDKVDFHNADMFEVLQNHEDKSNTIILCRNVMFFLSDREIDRFTTLAGSKLKNGSIIVTGEWDAEKVNPALEIKGFVRVFQNVYMKE